MKRFFILWLKILPLSVFVVWLFISYLEDLGNLNNESRVEKKEFTISEIKEILTEDIYDNQLRDCLLRDINNGQEICNREILSKYNGIGKSETQKINRNLIYLIYFLLALALNSQLTLFFYSKNKNNLLSKSCFYISDWSINSAPILGVLGTITAFSILMANSQGQDITKLFGQSFFDSAITTLLGGFIYIFNLYLNIYIQPKIEMVK